MEYKKVSRSERISEYILDEKLGEGAFGEVWKAYHYKIPDKFVAIKLPKSPEHVEFIKKEAIFQHKLSHPNIVKTIGLNLDHDPPYFIMEYSEGKNLRKLMQEEGILPPPYAIDIAVQLLDALSYAHSKDIIHKDIKPENLIIEKRKLNLRAGKYAILYYLKVTDLGLGKFPEVRENHVAISNHSRTSGVRFLSGTMFYTAPEQMHPGMKIDRRSDIYSIGVVLYEMLTGELPLGMDLPSELNPVVTSELNSIVKKALSIDLDIRYSSCDQMKADLLKAKQRFIHQLSVNRAKGDEQLLPAVQKDISSVSVYRRHRPSKIALLLLSLFVLVSVVSIFLLIKKYSQTQELTLRLITAKISVGTDPEGAEVYLDNVKLGITPVIISNFTYQTHEIKLKRKFYDDRILVLEPYGGVQGVFFKVKDKSSDSVIFIKDFTTHSSLENIRLERQKGTLRIQTPNVAGARIYINNRLYGSTPVELENFDAGIYTIRFEKEGYKTLEQILLLSANTCVEKSVDLQEDKVSTPASTSKISSILVETIPSEAVIFINGDLAGKSPCKLDLPFGEHNIQINRKYYEQLEDKIICQEGMIRLRYNLKKIVTKALLDSEPQGAQVFINDKGIGTTPLPIDQFEAGSYELKFILDDFKGHVRRYDITSSDLFHLKVQLERKKPATLKIILPVSGANIYIDDIFYGTTLKGEGTILECKPGEHKIFVLGKQVTLNIEEEQEINLNFSSDDLELAYIPEGEFFFGSKNPAHDEISLHKESLAGFYIDRYEVTNEQYAIFLDYIRKTSDHSRCHELEKQLYANKNHTPEYWDWSEEKFQANGISPDIIKHNHPVVGIDFFDACAYASWVGKSIPTEREWEKAARGPNGLDYPWGNVWDTKRLNFGDKGEKDGFEWTSPCGFFEGGKGFYGCYDMAGNVSEWCDDLYDSRGNEVIKGGSYLDQEYVKTYTRYPEHISTRRKYLGFRCIIRD